MAQNVITPRAARRRMRFSRRHTPPQDGSQVFRNRGRTLPLNIIPRTAFIKKLSHKTQIIPSYLLTSALMPYENAKNYILSIKGEKMENLIRIGDIEKFSIVDFPSKIAAVVFMQGCPWRCPFCYNQSLQNPNGESDAKWAHLIHLLEHRKGILDAVVFSGGEPLMQNNLPQAIDAVKALGFEVGLHTGGYNPDALAKVLDKVVWVGFDIKAPFDPEHYKRATGIACDMAKIKQSLDMLINSGVHFECRTTCDPRLLKIADIYKIADELSALGVKECYIQKYRPIPSDTTTQESDCGKFFNDAALLEYLHSKFAIFDVRK